MKPETRAKIAIVKQALLTLAGVCDGAKSTDGLGFNKIDARNELLRKAVVWAQDEQQQRLSFRQIVTSLKLIQKYRSQLLKSAAIALPDQLEELEAVLAADDRQAVQAAPAASPSPAPPPSQRPSFLSPPPAASPSPAPPQAPAPPPAPAAPLSRYELAMLGLRLEPATSPAAPLPDPEPSHEVPYWDDDDLEGFYGNDEMGFGDGFPPSDDDDIFPTDPRDPDERLAEEAVREGRQPEGMRIAERSSDVSSSPARPVLVLEPVVEETPPDPDHVEFFGTVTHIKHGPTDQGFVICSLRIVKVLAGDMDGYREVTGKGTIASCKIGAEYKVTGKWKDGGAYGRQVQVQVAVERIPENEGGLISWLTSIPDIGPARARAIVKHFGVQACRELLHENPSRVQEVPGIGPELGAAIARKIEDRAKYAELIVWLGSLGVSHSFIDRIRDMWGEQAQAIITGNPYRLMEIPLIGFKKADAIARSLGISFDSPFRIAAGILHAISDHCQDKGHCYVPRPDLLVVAGDVLRVVDKDDKKTTIAEVSRQKIAAVIDELVAKADLIEETWEEDGRKRGGLWPKELFDAERQVVETMIRLLSSRDNPKNSSFYSSFDVTMLEEWQALRGTTLAPHQEEAVVGALSNPVFVMTGGPGTGKGLALDTPLPGPSGWTTMGDIQVGDQLFDEKGRPCNVTFVSKVHHRPCFRVCFDDGSSLIADDEHRWLTTTRTSRKRDCDPSTMRMLPSVVSTTEIRDTLTFGREKRLNHTVDLARAFDAPHAELPVAPYVFGRWISNAFMAEDVKRRVDSRLESLGVLESRRIPRIPSSYLFASLQQRMALLQGIESAGKRLSRRVDLTFFSKELAADVYQLICGLGMKVYRSERTATLNGEECGVEYAMSFIRNTTTDTLRSSMGMRYITAVEPIDSVPTRCIQVDSPSHLFLAGESFIPTHNTTTVRAIVDLLTKLGRPVALAAPTGRAARRLGQATGRSAMTIHRMVGLSKDSNGQRRNDGQWSDARTVILDEVSMVDLPLMRALIKILHPTHSQLILVGDIDQLPSVGPGSVLRDVLGSEVIPSVRLTQVFRQQGGQENRIVSAAHAINSGVAPELQPYRGAESLVDGSMCWIEVQRDEAARIPREIIRVMRDLQTKLIEEGREDDPFELSQVLAPQRTTDAGVKAINDLLQSEFNPDGEPIRDGYWIRVGDKVMQTRNNYDLDFGNGVFNGDVGYVAEVDRREKKVVVNFEGRPVTYKMGETDDLVLAYGCTIHKSQGSEYRVTMVVCCSSMYKMLSRQLLYTGVTRGKSTVIIIGDRRAIERAVANGTVDERYTRLAYRLRECLQLRSSKSEGNSPPAYDWDNDPDRRAAPSADARAAVSSPGDIPF